MLLRWRAVSPSTGSSGGLQLVLPSWSVMSLTGWSRLCSCSSVEDSWLVFKDADGWWWWWGWRPSNSDRLCAFILSVWSRCQAPDRGATGHSGEKQQTKKIKIKTVQRSVVQCSRNLCCPFSEMRFELLFFFFLLFKYLGYLHPN